MTKRKADLHKLHPAGHHPSTEDRVALQLAKAIHNAESDDCAVSWSAQDRAQNFYNRHGLSATLDTIADLDPAYHNERGLKKTLDRIAEMLS